MITDKERQRLQKLAGIISEGKQVGSLYHYTDIQHAIKILESNTLKATAGNEPEFGKFYSKNTHRDKTGKVISFSRDKMKYNFSISDEAEVVFVIDGDKLSNKYSLSPFSDQDEYGEDEQEERIYNRDITNLINYIEKIIIYNTKYIDDLEVSDLIEIIRRKNIPYEIQEDPQPTEATKKILARKRQHELDGEDIN